MSENEHTFLNIFLVKLHPLYVAITVIAIKMYFLTHIVVNEEGYPKWATPYNSLLQAGGF